MSAVVITGIGAVTPVGLDTASTWEALLAGRSGVATVPDDFPEEVPVRIAAPVVGFEPERLLDRKRVRRSARASQLAVAAGRQAVADAGLGIDESNTARTAVVVNTAVPGLVESQRNTEAFAERGVRGVNPYYVSSSIGNMPACEVAIDLGIHGPVTAGAQACASGVYALLEARRLIAAGEADVAIAGGTDAGIGPVVLSCLAGMGALSRRNDEPTQASRPFDADRDGFVFGEGSVLLVLERAEHAAARGALPYARLAGGALTCDAFHVSAPDPGGRYAAEAIRQALARTGTTPSDVDYICAHGTSTRINDRVETAAIREVLGSAADEVAVSSPKSMVGHLIGAAGALSSMVAALSIRDGMVPPTINLDTPDPECDLDYVPKVSRPLPVRTAMVNAFGFGGQNCVALFTTP